MGVREMRIREGFSAAFVSVLLGACGGGGAAVSSVGTSTPPAATDCVGNCANASTYLTAQDVQQILAQGVAEASARGAAATIAVVDRVGNVLAVYRMPGAHPVTIGSAFDAAGAPLVHSGLEGLQLPYAGAPGVQIDGLAAIAKAVTGAYLSSEGNAFSTRTASQIIQQHFNPGVTNQPSGPLFGVQFSQLACSDFVMRGAANGALPGAGPHPSPLGLAADPGGFPLYKGGTVVGGVGAIADGQYSLDTNIEDIVVGTDEAIAMAATYNYAAPVDRRADEITAGGLTLRFTDVEFSSLTSNPASASGASLPLSGLIAVPGYADGQIHAGVAFGQPNSGIISDNGTLFPGEDAYIFVDPTNTPRFPPIAGTDAAQGVPALTQAEVQQTLQSALGVANQTRAQIRLPVGLTASVTIAVVDTTGAVLGMARTRDAPVFGADVSLQKARTAALFSSGGAAAFLQSLPANYPNEAAAGLSLTPVSVGQYVTATQAFLAAPAALTDGGIAYSDRAVGNLARPFFPDGIDGGPNGPLSKPIGQWSIFSTGLQLDLSIDAILQNVLFAAGLPIPDVTPGCAGVAFSPTLSPSQTLPAAQQKILGNGLQIFPGSVPIYRGATLVGAVGVSGDGVDQDDMIAFLGLARASAALNGSIAQAPANRRADTLTPHGTRLLYVQCPQSPFVNSSAENVCDAY